jgi:hypothetical protein
VQTVWAIAVVLITAAMYAQSAPPPCPADRPIDEIIGDIHREQSNKKHRNKVPWPQAGPVTTPPTFPEPAPKVHVSTKQKSTISSESSSEPGPAEKCATAMNIALEAAHDVDVGDYYFQRQNYSGALQRYNDAAEEKPGDLAIHVRLGRAFERLGQIPQAIQEYKAALKLAGPQKRSEEAKSALIRLQPTPFTPTPPRS